MTRRLRLHAGAAPALAALALAALAGVALGAPAAAQTIREKTVTDNPSRTPGGSCIYGGDGKLIHAPRGAACPEVEGGAPPASIAEDSASRAPAKAQATPPVASAPRAGAPQPTRAQLAALLAERDRLDVELARVRQAVAYEDREAARAAVEDALGKIARHLENEARLLQPLAGSN